MWLITNIIKDGELPFKLIFKSEEIALYGDVEFIYSNNSGTHNYSFGYLLNTLNSPGSIKSLTSKKDFGALSKETPDYRKYLKGNFTLVSVGKDWFTVDGDRFGVQKWFYWNNGKQFIVSDSLSAIRQIVNPEISPTAMAMYALIYHFTGGLTLFDGVKHNVPAQYIEYKQGSLKIDTYWDPLSLLREHNQDVSIQDIVKSLSDHVSELLNTHEGKISLSLTGGADTRNILAIMLKNGVKPHLYTYGNPLSTDCLRASAIAKGLRLEHVVHDIKMTPELFADYGKKIINWGQSLSSIHRAHRIIAVEREAESCDVMYLGTLGGEFVKGVSEDDYIVAAMVTDNWNEANLSNELIDRWLQKKALNLNNSLLPEFVQILNTEPYFKGSIIEKKMASLTHITAHLHDAQDLVLYQQPFKYVFTPFLDYDYLKTLFSSGFPFNKKEVINNPIKRRVVNPVYASNFIRTAYPALGRFEYCGAHKPDEVLLNPYYGALRRELRKINRKKDPANFPLGNWMQIFVRKELSGTISNSPIANHFDLHKMNKELAGGNYTPKESFWLKYTNPIMMDYILRHI